MYFYAIRGATTVETDEPQEIYNKTRKLLAEILHRNVLHSEDIVSILFTATKDITAAYPAVAAREMGLTDVPLLCCQEMVVDGSLSSCIRILMHVQRDKKTKPVHIYREGAVILRPDWADGDKEPPITIAIDGPAGAGKSTIAKRISKHLGILYLDTGAMYRAIALKMLESGIDPSNAEQVVPVLAHTDIQVLYDQGTQVVLLNGEDVTGRIRRPEISGAASKAAVIPEVRMKLVELQRSIARKHSLVMDGRDIGTYVLPDAPCKFFLTASLKERARRRHEELKDTGSPQDFQTTLDEIAARDENDSSRAFAPLKKAEDAILVDTTGKSIDEVTEEILRQL